MRPTPWDFAERYCAVLLLEAQYFFEEVYKTLLDFLRVGDHDSQIELGVFSNST